MSRGWAGGAAKLSGRPIEPQSISHGLFFAGEAGTSDSFPCWMNNTTVAFSSDSGGNDNVYKVTLPASTSATLLVPKAIEPWYGVTSL